MEEKGILRKETNERMKKIGRNSGITLIVLVLTIVVLIILATVGILAVFGDNGTIKKAQDTKSIHEKGKSNEANRLEDYASYIESYLGENGGNSIQTGPAKGWTGIMQGGTIEFIDGEISEITDPETMSKYVNVSQCTEIEPQYIEGYLELAVGKVEFKENTLNVKEALIEIHSFSRNDEIIVKEFINGQWQDMEALVTDDNLITVESIEEGIIAVYKKK